MKQQTSLCRLAYVWVTEVKIHLFSYIWWRYENLHFPRWVYSHRDGKRRERGELTRQLGKTQVMYRGIQRFPVDGCFSHYKRFVLFLPPPRYLGSYCKLVINFNILKFYSVYNLINYLKITTCELSLVSSSTKFSILLGNYTASCRVSALKRIHKKSCLA